VSSTAFVRPLAAGTTGGTRRYAEKTFAQKVATEFSSLLRPSRASIADHDHRLHRSRAALTKSCESAERAMLIVEDGGALTWRHAMYYVPEATTVQWPSPRARLLVAKGRRTRIGTIGSRARGDCVAHLVAADARGLLFARPGLRPISSMRIGAQRLDSYAGPVELVSDGDKAVVRHRSD
jgi:hypothetical protein